MAGNNLKNLRILAMLLLLLAVAGGEYLSRHRTTDWDAPLWVVVYPINADGGKQTAEYIRGLTLETFQPIERFFQRQARDYRLAIDRPVQMKLADPLNSEPPLPPRNGKVLSVMWWSLKLRYWAWARDNFDAPKDVRIFVRYFDPAATTRVAHSLGLQKGMVGIVNAFSSKRQNAQNNVIIAHELLHTLGATDKYDPNTNQPLYPIGYAEPDRSPLLPQKKAEIMGGRIAISTTESVIPKGLKTVVVGKETALEIRWLK